MNLHLGSMFRSLLSAYDTHHPDLSDLLVNSVKSYINSKLEYERKSPEFIIEVRRRLYLIHEYNDQVAKLTHTYPRSRKFDLLLVKYVELEFEALYHRNPNPPKQAEVITELRVLRLLQVMLYQTVLNNESIINENTDAILKKAVLKLLSDVKSSCLVKNKLVYNIANKLLKKVNGRNSEFNSSILDSQKIHRSLATSDYGTDDDDSDFENDVHNKITSNSNLCKEKATFASVPDCVEVPLTENGVVPIPTIEFADDDDDDDSYMVYLQQQKKKHKDSSSICNNLCNTRNNPNKFVSNKICDNETINAQNESVCENQSRNTREDDCVILSSDEENSSLEAPKQKNKHVHKGEKRKDKNVGVVTFEIIDDDDDQPTYMMYLQKEVKTNKKRHLKAVEPEVIICSDSDSDDEATIIEKSNETSESLSINTQSTRTNDEDTSDETNITQQRKAKSSKNNSYDSMFDEDTLDDILNFVDTRSSKDKNDTKSVPVKNSTILAQELCSTNREASPEVRHTLNKVTNKEAESPITSITLQDSTHLLMLENEIGMNFSEESPTNFLIDPAVVFEEMTNPSIQSKTDTLVSDQCSNTCGNQEEEPSTSNACFQQLCIDRPNAVDGIIGGPVLSEKMDDSDDLYSLQEHSLNTSMLDIFLDDNYLLEGRKQFEELECFLFDDSNKEGLGYYDGINLFGEENESATKSEMSKDAKSVESLLNESQIFMEDKEICPHEINKSPHGSFGNKQNSKRVLKRKHKTKKNCAVKNCNHQLQEVFKNVPLTNFLHQTENNLKASGKRKSGKTNLR